jgi:hypothetical protein
MNEKRRVEGFRALTASDTSGSYYLEDVDGDFRTWREMSAEGKLRQLAGNAVYYGVPFEPFAEAVRNHLGDLPAEAREEAALRLVLRHEQELRGLEQLLPRYDRLEPAPPLIERFQEVLDSYADRADKSPERSKTRGIER